MLEIDTSLTVTIHVGGWPEGLSSAHPSRPLVLAEAIVGLSFRTSRTLGRRG